MADQRKLSDTARTRGREWAAAFMLREHLADLEEDGPSTLATIEAVSMVAAGMYVAAVNHAGAAAAHAWLAAALGHLSATLQQLGHRVSISVATSAPDTGGKPE